MVSLNTLPHRRAWSLAWPLMLSNLTTPLMGLADTAMLGHQPSHLYLAAAAIGANVLTFSLWAFGFLRMGTTSLTGRALGANLPNQAKRLLHRSLVLGCALGLLVIVLQFLLLPHIIALMSPDAAVRELARSYCAIRFLAAPAVLMTYAALGWFIGLQQSRLPLIIMLAINSINLALDWLFIMHFGWGSDGAAIASACAEYAGLLLAAVLIWRELARLSSRSEPTATEPANSEFTSTQPTTTDVAADSFWSGRGWLALMRINSDLFVRTFSLLAVFSFFTAWGARLGPEVVAANAILLQLLLLASHGLDGYAHAAETMVANAVGARHSGRFIRDCGAAGVASLGVAIMITAFFLLGKSPLVWLLTDLEGLRDILRQYWFWLVLLPLVSVWSYLFDGIFIGAGYTQDLRNWMLFSVIFVFLPGWWLTQSLENHGLWLAFTLFNLSRGLTLAGVFAATWRRNRWLA